VANSACVACFVHEGPPRDLRQARVVRVDPRRGDRAGVWVADRRRWNMRSGSATATGSARMERRDTWRSWP